MLIGFSGKTRAEESHVEEGNDARAALPLYTDARPRCAGRSISLPTGEAWAPSAASLGHNTALRRYLLSYTASLCRKRRTRIAFLAD